MSVSAKTSGRLLDIRVAILPTVEGEGAIMRLLDQSRKAPTLTEIGLSKEIQMQLEDLIHKPTGALLVTGPTGSGKSTTVYAAVADIRRPEINIITIEDPVEYRLEDVYQLQVSSLGGVTFASALRVDPAERPGRPHGRRDPRSRDGEDLSRGGAHRAPRPLDAAYEQRAGGGHAPERDGDRAVHHCVRRHGGARTTPRTAALSALPRAVRPERGGARRVGVPGRAGHAHRKRGCDRCTKGYSGRVGVYELMIMNQELRRLVGQHADLPRDRAGGSRCRNEDALGGRLEKVAAGLTTLDELERLLG